MTADSERESELIRKIAQLEVELLKSKRKTEETPGELRKVAEEYEELRKALDDALGEETASIDWESELEMKGGEALESAFLGEEIRNIKRTIGDRETDLFRSSVMISGLEGKIKDLEAGFREKEDLLISKTKEVRALSEIVKRRNEQLNELRSQIRELEGENLESDHELALREARIKELEADSEKLREDFERLKESIKAKNVQLAESADNARVLENRIRGLESALDETNSKMSERESMIRGLEEGLASMGYEMEGMKAVLLEKNKELKNSINTIRTFERRGKNLERTCGELKKKLKNAEKEVESREMKIEKWQEKVKELNSVKKALDKEIKTRGTKIASLEAKIKTLKEANNALKRELDAAKKIGEAKDQKLQEVAGIQRELTAVEKAAGTKERELEQSSERIRELETTLNEHLGKIAELEERRREAESKVKEREEVIAIQLQELEGLRDVASSTPDIAKIQSAMKSLEEQLGEKRKVIEEKEREIGKKERDIENLRKETGVKEAEISMLKSRIDELEKKWIESRVKVELPKKPRKPRPKKEAKREPAPKLDGFLEDVETLFEKYREAEEEERAEAGGLTAAIKVVDLRWNSKESRHEVVVWNNGGVPLSNIRLYVDGGPEAELSGLGVDERANLPASRVTGPGEYELKVTSNELAEYVCKRKV